MFLMETLIEVDKVEVIKKLIRYEGCHVVDNEGHSGSLIMFWKTKRWARVISSLRNHIALAIEIGVGGLWRLIGYYGYPEINRRREVWFMLRTVARASSLPWCCIGDYNDLLAHGEKIERCSHQN